MQASWLHFQCEDGAGELSEVGDHSQYGGNTNTNILILIILILIISRLEGGAWWPELISQPWS